MLSKKKEKYSNLIDPNIKENKWEYCTKKNIFLNNDGVSVYIFWYSLLGKKNPFENTIIFRTASGNSWGLAVAQYW